MRLVTFFVLLASAIAPARAGASDATLDYVAADPRAPAVTRDNLLASERFWPYQVELREAWQPEGGAAPLAAGTLGVLVRIEPSGVARIDFGRDGRHEVPIEATDAVERANGVRLGELWKPAPNLVHAIAPRLIDAASEVARAYDFLAAFEPRGFVSVFADPGADGFAELAQALAPLRGRHGVLTVLFPQGAHPAAGETRERLRALAWPVPFVMDGYAEGYTRSLLPDALTPPAVLLHTREGRLIFQSAWREGVAAELGAALERAFGAALASGGAAGQEP